MRHAFILLACAMLVVVGCEAKPVATPGENAQAVTLLGDIHKVLEGVKDTDTAKAAAGQLTQLTDKVAPLIAKVKSLGESTAQKGDEGGKSLSDLSKNVVDKAKSAIGGPLQDIMGRITAQISRISQDATMLEPLKGVIEKLKPLVQI
ncbi:MAG: hypothetical protein JXQ29_15745 [Planctomycetes bacterium]|nr:hypothetical protein [Planctomycetota bacterium]